MTAVQGAAPFAFGEAFTNHMVVSSWRDGSWEPPRLRPYGPLPMDPAMAGLHYGQVVFEGLKGHRLVNGGLGVFRPLEHARRFQRSARRLAMPEFPADLFVGAVEDLVREDGPGLPDDPALSLYLRPVLFASEASLALRPARAYTFVLLAFVTGAFFSDRTDPVRIWVSRDHVRAAPLGTGEVKCAGNYAASFLAQQEAAAQGCSQVLWLDPVEGTWVEEMGGMNVFFVHGTGEAAEVVTPARSGTILAGVTRDSVISLATRRGLRVREERIALEDLRERCLAGDVTEAFACGTAAVISPIGGFCDAGETWTVGDGRQGPVTKELRDELVSVHRGLSPDEEGWLHRL
ncbi:branched-chain amino acid aminotransferase [Streptomyces sp. NBC_00048]|uniref:branched-chain amino acid aminotransferase n=1 Tax=Streptomyces sp. NBC_00048 TaxID=2975628 RepID=UPI00324D7EE6